MAESKVCDEFVTHEFDEAIAVHRAIVEAEASLAKGHPHAESKAAIAAIAKDDKAFLRELERLGKQKGATGRVEDVAEGIIELLESMVGKAGEAPREAYEGHAVLLNAKRKQQDSVGGLLRIARALKDSESATAAQALQKRQKSASDQLADLLADFAVAIATAESDAEAAGAEPDVRERQPTTDAHEPSKGSSPGDLPTTAGGVSGIEPQVPGQSLGQVPEHDDDDRDEAGDANAGGPGTHGVGRAPA